MFGIVTNKEGYKIEFVHIFDDGTIDGFKFKEDEQLITDNWKIANAMITPRWDGAEWVETATEEEIQAFKHLTDSTDSTQRETSNLKSQLQQSDYMIIKCYEYQLAGKETPYNLEALHRDRQAMRDKINLLER